MVDDVPENDVPLLPLPHDPDIEGLLSWIEVAHNSLTVPGTLGSSASRAVIVRRTANKGAPQNVKPIGGLGRIALIGDLGHVIDL